MARVSNGCVAKRMTMTVNGIIRPTEAANFTVRINGDERSWSVSDASPHAAAYSAAISAMIEADAAGVTHLTLQTPANLVRRQATGDWSVESPALRRVKLIYEILRIDFDDVDWIKGAA